MRLGSAASALALLLAACGASGDSAHREETTTEAHGAEAGHGETAAANGHGPALGPAEAHAGTNVPHPAAHQQATHWGYGNQRAWAGVSGLCGRGQEQSPINLSSAAPMAEVPDLAPRYLPVEGGFVNNGHTLQFNPAQSAATLGIGHDNYTFAQFHFHAPAEHMLDRRAYPAELHFVHRNEAGQLAVVGVFIEEGAENSALAALLEHAPREHGDEFAEHLSVNLTALLPPDRAYFAYAGSLTTPPCSEGVRWNVLRTPITASAQQIAALREALGSSSRHTQPVNGRTVLLGS
ncbi:MAG: carbonic anhydrase family protein [Hyphomonadaceae bacterium]|jgi:carbonic anhydrase|nr:carbonic anhydrase family protein [Caulobacteraceae bacterium]MBP6688901.1 carbonic anhydrase family protein [Hyphomonadaceae bacterium]